MITLQIRDQTRKAEFLATALPVEVIFFFNLMQGGRGAEGDFRRNKSRMH